MRDAMTEGCKPDVVEANTRSEARQSPRSPTGPWTTGPWTTNSGLWTTGPWTTTSLPVTDGVFRYSDELRYSYICQGFDADHLSE